MFIVRFSPQLGILFSNQVKLDLYIYKFESNMGFESIMSILVQTWIRVTEVYLSQPSLKIHVFTIFTNGCSLVPNGKKGSPFQRTFTGTFKHLSQRRH